MDSFYSCITLVFVLQLKQCLFIKLLTYNSTLCSSSCSLYPRTNPNVKVDGRVTSWNAANMIHVFLTELGCGTLLIWKNILKDPPPCHVNRLFLEILYKYWFSFTKGHYLSFWSRSWNTFWPRSSTYRIVGNFCEAEIFAIFAIKHQLAKICSSANFFLHKFLADKSSTVPSSRRSSKSPANWPILS